MPSVLRPSDTATGCATTTMNPVFPALFERPGFCSPTTPGRKLSARYVQQMVSRYASKAGIGFTVTPHTLRHSYATQLLKEGVPVRYIQELLGHSSLNTTMIYMHVDNEDLKRAVEVL